MKAGFVEKIGSTVFIVNAMPSENASETQEELVKALIIKDVMASKAGKLCRRTFTMNIDYEAIGRRIRTR